MDFSAEDRINFNQYNRILWKGLMGDKPYPESPTGLDLRANRAELLARYHANSGHAPVETSQKSAAKTGGGQ